MHVDLEKLIVLQVHDLEARRLRDEMIALPKLVAGLEAKAKATVGQRAVVIDLIAKEDALRRRQEFDIKDLQQKIAKTTTKVDQATSAAHVTAFEHEIQFAKAEIARLEDVELESMERSEALEAQRKLADAAVEAAAKLLERESLRSAETVARDKIAVAEEDRLRAAIRAEVMTSSTGEASLATYDRIAKGKGTAISEALNQKCTACQMMVRPQRWNDLKDNSADSSASQTLMTCENCGRLLYYDPARDSPDRKIVPFESIAASIVRSL